MKILYYKWNSFGADDIQEAFEKQGNETTVIPWSDDNVFRDNKLQEGIKDQINTTGSKAVFTFDYYPPIAVACYETGTPYVSWIYDSPYVMLYSFTVIYETNYIFVFDSEVFREFAENGIKTVHYMPLASNPARLRRMIEDKEQQKLFRNSIFYNKSDIAFIGSMYDEENTFYRRLDDISDYTRGYLEGIMASQRQIWGYNFVRKLLCEDMLNEMFRAYPLTFDKDCVAEKGYVYAEYCINREITARERAEYLNNVGYRFANEKKIALDLYTMNEDLRINGAYNHGFVGPEKIAPFVYDRAKINLNITLRSIHAGIPLRVFEILGSGGFLLSNYQSDFADCYVDGEDYVSFDSKEDMLNKIEYYLSHENERRQIAENGIQKTRDNHTYEHRIREMFSALKGDNR